MRKFYLVLLLALLPACLSAQVITRFTSADQVLSRVPENPNARIAGFSLNTRINVDSLLKEDAYDQQHDLPFRFGVGYDVDLGLKNGSWTDVEGGKVWQLRISSVGAHSLNLQFNNFQLAEGAELTIYNAEKTMLMGPITAAQNNSSHLFNTDLVQGSAIVLELFEPAAVAGRSQLHIKKVIHGYKPVYKEYAGYGQSLPCEINVNCTQGDAWRTESNAVAMMLLENGDRWCSGSMINNTCNDFRPYFLSAFHCTDGRNVSGMVFRFNYKSPGCTSSDGTSFISFNGATLRAAWQTSDFALMELNTRPAQNSGITYAGWSRSTNAPASSTGIHHPNGDVMKISIDNDAATDFASDISWVGGTVSPAHTHWQVMYDQGGIEGGSSGSPLFNPNHQIVGQLHGGRGNCPGDAIFDSFYGRFDISWIGGGSIGTRLKDWLDPSNTGAQNVNTIITPSITGPDFICSNGSGVYQLTALPAGSNVTWSASTTFVTLTPAGSSVTVTDNGTHNYFTLTATITNPCGTSYAATKQFFIGEPVVQGSFTVNGTTHVLTPAGRLDLSYPNVACYGYQTSTNMNIQGAGTVTWTNAGMSSPVSWSQVGNNLRFTFSEPDQWAIFRVTVTNNCGTTSYTYRFKSESCGGVPPVNPIIQPNPAAENILISIPQTKYAEDVNARAANPVKNGNITEVRVYDMTGKLRLRQRFTGNSKKEQMNVGLLNNGNYIIEVFIDGRKKSTEKLFIYK